MTEIEKMENGYLWEDTKEYFEEQRITRELLYDFNHSRPSEEEKRKDILKKCYVLLEKMLLLFRLLHYSEEIK
ncbi:maltose acetyltransferase domain-containing protein [Brachyspira pulli]|uniref:maltose acetyltransferase domain-containing protein n=1 Tax=Brachyspira pulli TaxID=310721 RepID=UPI0030047A70